jgi:hypothetical protein
MTDDRTIHELTQEYGMAASAILDGYHGSIDEIRDMRTPEAGGYLDQLTDEQRMALLREQKAEKVQDVRAQAIEAAEAEHEQYERAVSARRTFLKTRLFSVTGPDGASALTRTVTASDAELGALLDVALQADNKDLARAVFLAAQRRGAGDLMGRYFDELDPEGRDMYAEWTEVPTNDALQRQRESIPLMVRDPGSGWLTPPARVGS